MFAVNLPSAVEGGADVGDDVFGSNALNEVGMGEEAGGLFAGAAEEEGAAGDVKAAGELFDSVEPCGV